jgi:DNA-binding transcriptional regulator/RsmH inhibitor MraZ
VHNTAAMKDISDGQITQLFKYMQSEFARLSQQMEQMFNQTNSRIDSVYNLLDSHMKQRETDEQERLAMSRQLERHHSWIGQLSKGTGTQLVPEP